MAACCYRPHCASCIACACFPWCGGPAPLPEFRIASLLQTFANLSCTRWHTARDQPTGLAQHATKDHAGLQMRLSLRRKCRLLHAPHLPALPACTCFIVGICTGWQEASGTSSVSPSNAVCCFSSAMLCTCKLRVARMWFLCMAQCSLGQCLMFPGRAHLEAAGQWAPPQRRAMRDWGPARRGERSASSTLARCHPLQQCHAGLENALRSMLLLCMQVVR